MAFSDYSRQYFTDTGRSTGEYIIFYQGGTIIDHGTHVPGPVAQSSAESDYNASYSAIMYLEHFRVLIHELLNKDTDIVPEEAPIIILYIKYAVCMDNNGKDTNNTRHIYRRVHLVRNGKNTKCKILTGVNEVCNWQKLQLRILARMTEIPE